MKSSRKKCKDCKTPLVIVGEHPSLEWCPKCLEYKNKDQWEKEYSEQWPVKLKKTVSK